MSLTKVAVKDLNKEELQSFVRIEEGRYVLAKQLQRYDWDKGSVWKMTQTPEGQLVIAREEEEHTTADDNSTGIVETKCKSCGSDLKDTAMGGTIVRVCAHCNPQLAGMQKAAALQPSEIEETNPSGVPGNFTVEANGYMVAKLLPVIYSWLEAGFNDISKEGLNEKIELEKTAGHLSELDANMMLTAVPTLALYAKDYLNPPALIDEEHEEARYVEVPQPQNPAQQVPNISASKAENKLAFLMKNRPAGMSLDTFTTLYRNIKTAVHK